MKEQDIDFVIDRMNSIIESEQKHLVWLKENHAPKGMIEVSKFYVYHYKGQLEKWLEIKKS